MAVRRGTPRKKTVARKPRARSGPRYALPPPDDPLLRHEELDVDRRIAGEVIIVDSPSLTAARAAATGRRTRAKTGAKGESTVAKMCRLRLEALAHSRLMAHSDGETPTRTAVRRISHAAPGGVELVPPVAGTSNWVQLGPTAIPNGQTYSSARVLVTGRVTSIAIDPLTPTTLYAGAAQGG